MQNIFLHKVITIYEQPFSEVVISKLQGYLRPPGEDDTGPANTQEESPTTQATKARSCWVYKTLGLLFLVYQSSSSESGDLCPPYRPQPTQSAAGEQFRFLRRGCRSQVADADSRSLSRAKDFGLPGALPAWLFAEAFKAQK